MLRALIPMSMLVAAAPATEPAALRSDALAIEKLVNDNYAYLERLPGNRFALTQKLRTEAGAITTQRELVRYAERALSLLADHHAITGSSLKDSWAVFPSFGDLWIERRGQDFVIEQVRKSSPAEEAGIRAGDRLVAIDNVPAATAVAAFWSDLGTTGGGERDGYAARVLAAGRRDRQRILTVQRGAAPPRPMVLPNLYERQNAPDRGLLSSAQEAGALVIRFHDSLGDSATIPAFDTAMASARPRQPIVLDLTDTPGGGNSTVARAIIGWFVKKPSFYQMHNLPAEERETGIARQWVEQVLPRPGKYHSGPVTVRVGRWTGSMGEGIAIGFDAIGARVEGTRMAGLLGAIYDHRLPNSQVTIKFPTERLFAVDGTPREKYVPRQKR
ncbi:peptidase S41 [Sphingomonas sp. HDW15A]|uniref:S41 family peptidase n=1 Tax=Sphingomonas sp. HDW15A TaxID=2714942 RepID=UPI00140C8C3E|nr:PDZ domain-containing protein [Sphingomonas sp. HDW15A]QIK95396.1 peptidase S41 [Sphingomonas sp. HDW15A]